VRRQFVRCVKYNKRVDFIVLNLSCCPTVTVECPLITVFEKCTNLMKLNLSGKLQNKQIVIWKGIEGLNQELLTKLGDEHTYVKIIQSSRLD
jgi:hypothetical protein